MALVCQNKSAISFPSLWAMNKDKLLPAQSATFRCLILCSNLDNFFNHRALISVVPLPPHSLHCIRSYYWPWCTPGTRQVQRFSGPPGQMHLPLLQNRTVICLHIYELSAHVHNHSWWFSLPGKDWIWFLLDQRGFTFFKYLSGKSLPNDHSYIMSYFWGLLSVLRGCHYCSTLHVSCSSSHLFCMTIRPSSRGLDILKKHFPGLHHSINLGPVCITVHLAVHSHCVLSRHTAWLDSSKDGCSWALWYSVCCNLW